MKKNEGKAGTVLLVLIVLLLFTMAVIYGYLYISKLESRINALESEKASQINTIQTQTNTLVSQETNTSSKTFTNEEIKTCIQEYLDIYGASLGSTEGLLVQLNLTTFAEQKEHTEDNYAKTSIKFSDYKNTMLNHMTEEWFEKHYMKYFKDVDGYLWYFDGGATGAEWEVESVALKGDYSNSSYIATTYNIHIDDTKELEYIEFHIENNNGKCVISYCDY